MKNKKAQPSGTSAASLVVVIALIIILYLLFIPPEAREELLGPTTGTTPTPHTNVTAKVLLLEHPGTIDVTRETSKNIALNPIRLYTSTEPQVLKTFAPFYISDSFFDTNEKIIGLEIKDLPNTNNVLMTFNVGASKGRMIIELNGKEIFNARITKGYVDPIELPKAMLKEQNTLKFKTDKVGWRFWLKNEFDVNDLKIVADITDISKQTSKNLFLIQSSQLKNIKSSALRFIPECNEAEVSALSIAINDKEIFSGVPDCKSPVLIEFSPLILKENENYIEFKATKGTFLLDQVVIKNELKQVVNPVYFFNIDLDTLNSIIDNTYDIELYIEFVDEESQKSAKLIINGIETNLNQDERIYSKIINQYIRLGNNALEIVPRTRLDILTLQIRLIE